MLENFPLTEVLPKVFRGSGDCSESAWTLVGLTIADWSLLWFVVLAAATISILFARALSVAYRDVSALTSSNNPRSSERDSGRHALLRCR